MDKFCAVKQIECEHVIQCGYINFGHLRQCPWPSRQMPINDIAAEIAEMRKKPREQYLIFERAGYERGRADMKREIGEKVDAIPHTFGDVSFNKKNVLAAIEEVK